VPRNGTAEAGPRRLVGTAPGFAGQFAALLAARDEGAANVDSVVAAILEDVRRRGDSAVVEYTNRFDRVALTADRLRVTRAEIDQAVAGVPPRTVSALKLAARRIRDYHRRQMPKGLSYRDAAGLRLGARWTPVAAAGLYVPGGTAAYPSSVLMNAIPAKAAGVQRIAMATPPGKLFDNPAILAAAKIAGVTEIWKIGGAQAIAALAYGAGDLEPTDVVVGPGNAYVAAAKKLVYGDVGIDAIAGPSEVFVLCDGSADPRWIAADLMAQAEHDGDAQSVLFTTDRAFAARVAAEVEKLLASNHAGDAARSSWADNGAIVITQTMEEAAALASRGAPEHVQIAARNAEQLAPLVKHAGAIFVGAHAPEALGDYIAGPSHVLPTGRRARFSSGVSTYTFMKRTSLIGADARALAAIGPAAARIADAEGLPAHALSLRVRLGDG